MRGMQITDEVLELAGLRRVYAEGPRRVVRYEFFSVKKKRKKKPKGSAKKKAGGLEDAPEGEEERSSRISWGNVDAYYFKWMIGQCSVPAKGGTPLGFGEENEELHEYMSIDKHQSLVTSHLLIRARERGVVVSKDRSGDPKGSKKSGKEEWDVLLETRQRDFKKSNNKNPLYGPLTEEERVVLLSKSIRELSQRSYSMGDHTDARVSMNRSGSIDSASTQSSLNNNDSDEPSLADLNRELRKIRESRERHMGCSCRPIKIDKLSVVKMKAELLSHQGFEQPAVDAMSKPELATALKGSLKDCPLCTANNCLCVQLGIECRAETCECLRRREIQSCANPNGTVVFDSAAVSEYRMSFLGKAEAS